MEVHRPHEHQRRVIAATVGLGGGLAMSVLLVASPAGAADRAPYPKLSISVDNGRTSVDVGDTLDYTITVENIGADAVRDLQVTQTMPEGLVFESADRGGAAGKGLVVWSVDLAPGRTRTLHATMTVGPTPDEVLRLASVACASLSAKKEPLVCDTHSDELPAGSRAREREEAATAAQVAVAAEASSTWSDSTPARAALLGGAALVVALTELIIRHHRRRGPAAPQAATRRE